MPQTLAQLQRPDAVRPAGLPLRFTRSRTFDTPEFAGMTFLEVEAKTALNRVRGMPFPWSINPYRGCSHACSFCFARPTHRYLNLDPLGDFERTIVVKTNVAEVLRRELAKPSWGGEHVALGTNTDPYQRCEGRYRLLPGIITALAGGLTPFSILTKGTMITRDADLLVEAAQRVPVTAAVSIITLDEAVWRSAEPGTPKPGGRLDAVAALNAAGIPTGVMLAPIMPGINDDPTALTALVDRAVEAGATHVTPIVLHLRPGVRDAFWPWLRTAHPDLMPRYERLYRRGAQADKAYREQVEAHVRRARARAWDRRGRPPVPAYRGAATRLAGDRRQDRPSAAAEQLRLL